MADMFYAGIPVDGTARPLDADLYGADQQAVDAENISATGNLNIGNVIRYDEHAPQRYFQGGAARDSMDTPEQPYGNNPSMIAGVSSPALSEQGRAGYSDVSTPSESYRGAPASSNLSVPSSTPASLATSAGSAQSGAAGADGTSVPATNGASSNETTTTEHIASNSSSSTSVTNNYTENNSYTTNNIENYTQNNTYDNTYNNGHSGGSHGGGLIVINDPACPVGEGGGTINNIVTNVSQTVTTTINETINNIIDGNHGGGSHGGGQGSENCPPPTNNLAGVEQTVISVLGTTGNILNETLNAVANLPEGMQQQVAPIVDAELAATTHLAGDVTVIADNALGDVTSVLNHGADDTANLLGQTLHLNANLLDAVENTATSLSTPVLQITEGAVNTAAPLANPMVGDTGLILGVVTADATGLLVNPTGSVGDVLTTADNTTNTLFAPVMQTGGGLVSDGFGVANNALDTLHASPVNLGLNIGNILDGNSLDILNGSQLTASIDNVLNNVASGGILDHAAIADIGMTVAPVVDTILSSNGTNILSDIGNGSAIVNSAADMLNNNVAGDLASVAAPVIADLGTGHIAAVVAPVMSDIPSIASEIENPVSTALAPVFADMTNVAGDIAGGNLGGLTTDLPTTPISDVATAASSIGAPVVADTANALGHVADGTIIGAVSDSVNSIAAAPAPLVGDVTGMAGNILSDLTGGSNLNTLTAPVDSVLSAPVDTAAMLTAPVISTMASIGSGDISNLLSAAPIDITAPTTTVVPVLSSVIDTASTLTAPVTTMIASEAHDMTSLLSTMTSAGSSVSVEGGALFAALGSTTVSASVSTTPAPAPHDTHTDHGAGLHGLL